MCGICGIASVELADAFCRTAVERMTDRLKHRGPDGSGVFSTKGLALGHRRLAIIDLSSAAAQPMSDRRGFVITYNGELYNFVDVRNDLESLGEQFVTRADTEVVLK